MNGIGTGTRVLARTPNILCATIYDTGDDSATEEIAVLSFDYASQQYMG